MKAKDIKFDLDKLEKEKQENFKERLKFIDYWVNYIKNHSDREWGSQQNKLINSQIS